MSYKYAPGEDPTVHTTVRQRMKEFRKAEARQLYEQTRHLRQTNSQQDQRKVKLNTCGQAMDWGVTAIQRLVTGDFYTLRGQAIGEMNEKPRKNDEGATMLVSCGVNTDPPPSAKHSHGGQPHHHHCHHGHRHISEQAEDPHGMVGKFRPASAPVTKEKTYNVPTLSSKQKLALHKEAEPTFPGTLRPIEKYAMPPSARALKAVNPYETALQQAKNYAPGTCAVISTSELAKIQEKLAAEKKENNAPRNVNKKSDQTKLFY